MNARNAGAGTALFSTMTEDAPGREHDTFRRLAELLESSPDPDAILSAVQDLLCKNASNKVPFRRS